MTRKRLTTLLAGPAAVALIALIVAGCGAGGSGATATTAPTSAGGDHATVGTADNGSLGTILVDSKGRTLYLFQQDEGTKSECSGPCAASWPPVRSSGNTTVSNGASASLIGTSARSDGKPQVTYNGHPLYLYAGDQQAGDTNGQGLTDFGGGWYALSAAGSQVSGQSSGSGTGGGYGY